MTNNLWQQLTESTLLEESWQRVRIKKSAGGIDRHSIASFAPRAEMNINRLKQELLNGEYIPLPYQRFYIAKSNQERRKLGLLSIRDKILQVAVRSLLEPILEKHFLDVSYGYRPGKGPLKAVGRAKHILAQNKEAWMVNCDIDGFFDNISHQILFKNLESLLPCPKTLRLLKLFAMMGNVDPSYHWHDQLKGVPQGGVVSPVLANFYLHTLDQEMVSRKTPYVRYADDFILFAGSRDNAEQLLDFLTHFLHKELQLNLNPGAKVSPLTQGFTFLGVTFLDNSIVLSDSKSDRIRQKIQKAFDVRKGRLDTGLWICLDGISAYYGKLLPQNILESLDAFTASLYHNRDLKTRNLLFRQMVRIPWLSLKWQTRSGSLLKSPAQPEAPDASSRPGPEIEKTDDKPVTSADRHNSAEIKTAGANKEDIDVRKAVRSRKREYQKLASQQFDLLISEFGCSIGKSAFRVTVKHKGRVVQSLKGMDLKSISFISRGVSLSTDVIYFCSQRNIPVNFLGKDGKPFAKIFYESGFDASLGLEQLKAATDGRGMNLAKTLVEGKINNQINLVKRLAKYNLKNDLDFASAFPLNLKGMQDCLTEAENAEAASLEEMRGKLFAIEGRAAAHYWEIVKSLMRGHTDFDGRERKGAADLLNSLLNYGYAFLYSRVWDAILRAGLNPYISYLHAWESNRPSLVFDLIEEFRQQGVDRCVFALLTKGEKLGMEENLLDPATRKRVAVKVTEQINHIEKFRGVEMRFFDIVNRQARSYAQYLLGTKNTYKPYRLKW